MTNQTALDGYDLPTIQRAWEEWNAQFTKGDANNLYVRDGVAVFGSWVMRSNPKITLQESGSGNPIPPNIANVVIPKGNALLDWVQDNISTIQTHVQSAWDLRRKLGHFRDFGYGVLIDNGDKLAGIAISKDDCDNSRWDYVTVLRGQTVMAVVIAEANFVRRSRLTGAYLQAR